MSYKLSLTSVFLALILSACSVTDLVSTVLPSTNKPSVEANLAVGKTNTQDKSLASVKGEDNRQIADDIVNTTSTSAETINNTNISMVYLVLLILGWLLPSPNEIVKGSVSLFKSIKN